MVTRMTGMTLVFGTVIWVTRVTRVTTVTWMTRVNWVTTVTRVTRVTWVGRLG